MYQSNLVLYVDYHSLFPSREDKHMAGASSISDCVFFSAALITGGDTHSFCVVCLRAEHAESALEGFSCPLCECLSLRMLYSRRALFEEGAFISVTRGAGHIYIYIRGGHRLIFLI